MVGGVVCWLMPFIGCRWLFIGFQGWLLMVNPVFLNWLLNCCCCCWLLFVFVWLFVFVFIFGCCHSCCCCCCYCGCCYCCHCFYCCCLCGCCACCCWWWSRRLWWRCWLWCFCGSSSLFSRCDKHCSGTLIMVWLRFAWSFVILFCCVECFVNVLSLLLFVGCRLLVLFAGVVGAVCGLLFVVCLCTWMNAAGFCSALNLLTSTCWVLNSPLP